MDEGDVDMQKLARSCNSELVKTGIGARHGTGLSLEVNAAGTVYCTGVADIRSGNRAIDEGGGLNTSISAASLGWPIASCMATACWARSCCASV